ncbi:MAG: photosystem reaction center subunit H [Thermoplasmata archaeon]|nr:MAG: photosystem reaction center subunit H [Thermoplasmata archaeon]
MLMDISDIIGLEVYTDKAILVGMVKDVIIDIDKNQVYALYVEKPNPLLVEGGINIAIPYRWVASIGDIVVLRYFPRYIRTGYGKGGVAKEEEKTEEEKE